MYTYTALWTAMLHVNLVIQIYNHLQLFVHEIIQYQ